MSTRYAWSDDGEQFYGGFRDVEDAFADAIAQGCDEPVRIGPMCYPRSERDVDAWCVLRRVSGEDDDECEDEWDDATEEQVVELTAALQKAVGEWLDRHKLRETFFLVPDARQYVREGGQVVEWKGGE